MYSQEADSPDRDRLVTASQKRKEIAETEIKSVKRRIVEHRPGRIGRTSESRTDTQPLKFPKLEGCSADDLDNAFTVYLRNRESEYFLVQVIMDRMMHDYMPEVGMPWRPMRSDIPEVLWPLA